MKMKMKKMIFPIHLLFYPLFVHLVSLSLSLSLSHLPLLHAAASPASPVDYVNVLGGTSSVYSLSHGNSLPLLTTPWGFNSWFPITDISGGGWWFHPEEVSLYGIRCSHQPSPWINDYGDFRIIGSIVDPSHDDINQFSAYDIKKTVWKPYYFATDLLAYGTSDGFTRVEVTSTSHGAILRYAFPKYQKESTGYDQTRKIAVALNGGKDHSEIVTLSDGTIAFQGYSTANSGGVQSNFAHYFVVALYGGENGDKPITQLKASANSTTQVWATLDAANAEHEIITVRVATSLISQEQALLNFNEVATSKTFESVMENSKNEWNAVLSRIEINAIDDSYSEEEKNNMLTIFYSSMYRMSIFPRQLTEIDANGNEVHYSAYDPTGGVHDGPISTDSGFWDAYITVYPLLSLSQRYQLGVTIQGWINAYTEGGWLPKWASPGYRGCMVGTMGDVTLADAIVNKIPGFDVELAYDAIRKDAFMKPDSSSQGAGRECMDTYIEYGYIPRGSPDGAGGVCTEVVSRTLDYLQADYAIAMAASSLGHTSDASTLFTRSANYTKMFDASTGMIRSKTYVGEKWTVPFDEYAWGGDYTEAGPWQYRFSVPWDAKGLAQLYSSAGLDICNVLEELNTGKPIFHLGGYGSEIHEQAEMPINTWGQYAHNNQPTHHILYMYGAVDPDGATGSCAAKGQFWLRKATSTLYKPGDDMYTGDEDNGEMSAWYVLSSLGIYSLSPGSGDYMFGSPLFAKATINIDDENPLKSSGEATKTLVIVAENNSKDNVYVQEIRWNDQPIGKGVNSIKYLDLMEGGTLTFVMGPSPVASH